MEKVVTVTEDTRHALVISLFAIFERLQQGFKYITHPDRYLESWFDAVIDDIQAAKSLRNLIQQLEVENDGKDS